MLHMCQDWVQYTVICGRVKNDSVDNIKPKIILKSYFVIIGKNLASFQSYVCVNIYFRL